MKNLLKNTGYTLAGCALLLSVYSCGNGSNGTSAADSTATTASTTATTAATVNNNAASDTGTNNAGTNTDGAFVNDAYTSNAGEIMMLQAGIDKGSNKMLKEDARKMLADHKQLAENLQNYAKKKNMTLSAPPTTMDMSDMNDKKGKDWDKAWADKMVAGHQAAISKFESAQNTVSDPDLKAMITNTLPTLHKHLDMMQKLQSSLQ